MGRPLIVPKLVSIGYPLRLGAKLLFFSQFKVVRSGRDVVAVAEIPDYGELALALEERWGIGGVTSLITCHNKS